LTAKDGTANPQAAKTGEPAEPGRTQHRQPKAETPRAKADAKPNEPNGTNTQAGAGDHPAPPGSARRAHTQPQDKGRATMPAPRKPPKTETKPDINTPKAEEPRDAQNAARETHNPKEKKEKKRKRLPIQPKKAKINVENA